MLERAKELDEYYAKYAKTVGPLDGLPISLKVSICLTRLTTRINFRVKGVETSMGYVAWLGEKATQESVSHQKLFY